MEWKNYPSDVTIQSPPKLTRIIHLDSSKFLPSSGLKSQHGGEEPNLDIDGIQSQFSLPALAGEVADAQKQQLNELGNRHEIFEELQNEYFQVKQKIDGVKEEVSAITRKVVLAEEEAFQCKYQCQAREKGIKELVDIKRQMKSKIESTKRQIQKNKNEYDKYIDKMDCHRSLVAEYELSSDIGKEISCLELCKKTLSEEVFRLKGGQSPNEIGISDEYEILHTEIAHIQQINRDCEHNIEQQHCQLKKENERQIQLQKEIHLLQKRNHAQLTRLQRQLQEALGRSRHWNEEACKLETSIAQIREKIEE